MKTSHRTYCEDARELDSLSDNSVDLVVTSPPYPMIEMWDDLFIDMNPKIEEMLATDPQNAHHLMHDELDLVFHHLSRVVKPGGMVCINIGDATRTVNDTYQLFPNTQRIYEIMQTCGFRALPSILWRKPTNKLTKFMGSGMLPTNAYVTNEREYILIFQNGTPRDFPANDRTRYQSAYFWEERNKWFSDLWTDILGTSQSLSSAASRDRSAAYPFLIPYRLINMFSVQGDTVLDPFGGTGTTSVAALLSARNSVSVELDEGLCDLTMTRLMDAVDDGTPVLDSRLTRHHDYVTADGSDYKYESENYDTAVRTKQETRTQFQRPVRAERVSDTEVHAEYEPFTNADWDTERHGIFPGYPD